MLLVVSPQRAVTVVIDWQAWLPVDWVMQGGKSNQEQVAVLRRWPFSVGPIRGEISQQIAVALSMSGAALWFDPMKLA